MKTIKKISLLSVLALIGCGDVGQSPSDDKTANTRPSYDITGHAYDGLIMNGDVRVYDFSEGKKGAILGTGKTDSFGVFDASITGIDSSGSYVLSCVNTGSYIEESSGMNISLADGQELCAVKFFNPSNDFSVVINGWSHLASGLATFKVAQGEAVENAIDASNTALSSAMGFDILSTIPIDPTDSNFFGKSYTDQMKMGLAISGVSQMVLDIAKNSGLSRHTAIFSSISFWQTMHNDITTDGVIDGRGFAQNRTTMVSLGMGNKQFSRNSLNLDLSKSTIVFIKSGQNKVGITVSDVLSEQERIARSTNNIFGALQQNEPVPSLDEDGPTITWAQFNGQFVSGIINLSGTVNDFSGIKSSKIIIDSIEYDLGNGSTFNLPYQTNGNADLSVQMVAIDFLNNETISTIVLKQANSSPIPEFISESLVNNTSYLFKANLSNYDQGIKTISVNNETAVIDSNSLITSSINLTEGSNLITMVITDSIDIEHTYTFTVNVDQTLPELNFTTPNLGDDYKVYFKDPSIKEPYLSKIDFNKNGDPFYIDQFHKSLNGQSVSVESLRATNWAYLAFVPNDPATEANDFVSTPASELKVSYQYKQNDTLFTSREILPFNTEENLYVIPVSTEFLDSNWLGFDGVHTLIVTVEDKAGMQNSYSQDFTIYSSIPNVTTAISDSTWLSTENGTVTFESTDFQGVTTVQFIVNGVTYTSTTTTNPSFDLDLSGLNGLTEGTLRAFKDGELVYTDTISFNVDNTPVSLTVTSASAINSQTYALKGTAINTSSGVDFVQVDGSNVTYSLFDNTFTKTLTNLAEGLYSSVITSRTNADVESQITFEYKVDITDPNVLTLYPSASTPYQIDYQNNLAAAPTVANLQFTNDASKFYLTPEKIELGGNLISDSYLKSKRIPFVKFEVSDSYSNGAGTVNNEIVVNMSYYIDGITQFEDRELTSSANEYTVPITKEFLGGTFHHADPNKLHEIKFSVIDDAGNTVESSRYFKVAYNPDLEITNNDINPINYSFSDLSTGGSTRMLENASLTIVNDTLDDLKLSLSNDSDSVSVTKNETTKGRYEKYDKSVVKVAPRIVKSGTAKYTITGTYGQMSFYQCISSPVTLSSVNTLQEGYIISKPNASTVTNTPMPITDTIENVTTFFGPTGTIYQGVRVTEFCIDMTSFNSGVLKSDSFYGNKDHILYIYGQDAAASSAITGCTKDITSTCYLNIRTGIVISQLSTYLNNKFYAGNVIISPSTATPVTTTSYTNRSGYPQITDNTVSTLVSDSDILYSLTRDGGGLQTDFPATLEAGGTYTLTSGINTNNTSGATNCDWSAAALSECVTSYSINVVSNKKIKITPFNDNSYTNTHFSVEAGVSTSKTIN
jgi:hypothetical protein